MTIGTPTSIGSVTSASGNTSAITITTSAAIVAGNLVVVFVQIPSNVGSFQTVSTMSDGTNNYTRAIQAQDVDVTAYDTEMWYCANVSAVGSSASLTATLTGSTTGGNGYGMDACQVSGTALSSVLDKTASQVTSSTTSTPSATTATLSQANEIAFGLSMMDNGSKTYTEDSSFTNLFNVIPGNTLRAGVGYKIVSSTTAVTYAPTFSGVAYNQTVLATFKAAPQTFVPGPKWDSGSFATEIVSYG